MTDKEPIIRMTPDAVAHLQRIMSGHVKPLGLRLSVKQTGCSGYMYQPQVVSELQAGDVVVETPQGVTVFLDPDCVDMLRGTVIDFVQKELGMEQLVFDNPNAEALCGCGESFMLKSKAEE